MKKKNCWEYKRCGREPGGVKVHELGECKAATEEKLDGVHDGENGGRACWVIAGTMCGGKVQGQFLRVSHKRRYRNRRRGLRQYVTFGY